MSSPSTLTEFQALGVPEVTVVVPCYNERPNVAPLIEKLDAALFGIAWEVVFVDDNSPTARRPRCDVSPRPIRGYDASAASAGEA